MRWLLNKTTITTFIITVLFVSSFIMHEELFIAEENPEQNVFIPLPSLNNKEDRTDKKHWFFFNRANAKIDESFFSLPPDISSITKQQTGTSNVINSQNSSKINQIKKRSPFSKTSENTLPSTATSTQMQIDSNSTNQPMPIDTQSATN